MNTVSRVSSRVFYYNTPLYSLSSGPQINMVKQKKCIATIFENIFLYLFFRASYEDVDLKKVIIIFLNLNLDAFSTSVFHIMCKSSYGFHFIGSLYKMKKYKRIKKYFHFTARSNSCKYVLLEIFMTREQRIGDCKGVYSFLQQKKTELESIFKYSIFFLIVSRL